MRPASHRPYLHGSRTLTKGAMHPSCWEAFQLSAQVTSAAVVVPQQLQALRVRQGQKAALAAQRLQLHHEQPLQQQQTVAAVTTIVLLLVRMHSSDNLAAAVAAAVVLAICMLEVATQQQRLRRRQSRRWCSRVQARTRCRHWRV